MTKRQSPPPVAPLQPTAAQQPEVMELVSIRLPVAWTFAGLLAGLVLGTLLADTQVLAPVLALAEPIGTLWLRGLQMTIIPLVAALLVTGIAKIVAAARAGATARRMLLLVFVIILLSGISTVSTLR